MNKLWLASLLLFCISAGARADIPPPDGLRLGMPVEGGSGCPQGSTSAAVSPDGSAVSLIFDSYQVSVGGNTGKTMDRKTCDVVIPVHVPQGFSISIMAIDYRGFNSLPAGARSRFNAEYFFAGSHGPGFTRNYYGPITDEFSIHNDVVAQSVVWSACGADVNLRTNTSLLVTTNSARQEAMASVDSADVNASVVYQLQWKRCAGGGGGGGLDQPDPGQYQGNCTIDRNTDPWGATTWFVRDINQNLISRASSYDQALNIARQSDANGRCLGQPISPPGGGGGNGGGGGGGAVSCQVNTNQGVFFGYGYDQGSALADARNKCIRQTNNSRVCMNAPTYCR